MGQIFEITVIGSYKSKLRQAVANAATRGNGES